MQKILNIARNTFIETIRDKILLSILAFSFLFIAGTLFLGSISLGEDLKVVKDLGLAGIYIFSIIITTFLGTSLIYKEIEKRTIYLILSKPVTTFQFILGRFLGLFLSVITTVSLMAIFYLVVVMIKGGGFDGYSLLAIFLSFFEIAIVISLSILFSTFTTPLAGAIYTLVVVYIGHSLSLLQTASQKSGAAAKAMADAVYYIFPNLEKFNLRNMVVYKELPAASQIIYPVIYAVILCSILLWLANIAIKKRDF